MKINKGDKIIARSPAIIDENTFKQIGGHVTYEKTLTVKKVHPSGVSTKEMGFIHRRNIIDIVK